MISKRYILWLTFNCVLYTVNATLKKLINAHVSNVFNKITKINRPLVDCRQHRTWGLKEKNISCLDSVVGTSVVMFVSFGSHPVTLRGSGLVLLGRGGYTWAPMPTHSVIIRPAINPVRPPCIQRDTINIALFPFKKRFLVMIHDKRMTKLSWDSNYK